MAPSEAASPFARYEGPELEPWREIENLGFFLQNGLLFARTEEGVIACLPDPPTPASLNAYARVSAAYPAVVPDRARYEALKRHFEERDEGAIEQIEGYEDEETIASLLQNGDLAVDESSAPVIRYVNSLFLHALKKRATDIHVESFEKEGAVRFRIDGVLNRVATLSRSAVGAVINRIKVISNLDISETRLPQDGRTRIRVGEAGLDVRVSILPTYDGEKAVMRLLMRSDAIPSLEELGFSEDVHAGLRSLLRYSYGMILITGPTGSGKSTTLHAFLQEIDHDHFNIVTVEDPVEYNAHGINQIQVNDKIDLSFSKALRAILRQDPDIIMVGEMRDVETARIAVQAATTGHLLLSTLHTNSAVSALSRLRDLGVDDYLVSATLIGVVAQRLVRRLCPSCRRPHPLSEEDGRYFDLPSGTEVYEAVGCEACDGTGYIGRRAVGEILLVDSTVSEMIKSGASERQILAYLTESKGFVPLFEKVRALVAGGETSVAEAIRIGVKGI